MKKHILMLVLLVAAAFTLALFPRAYADSAQETVEIFGGKTAVVGELPVAAANASDIAVMALADGASADQTVNREMRGAWIATVKNINMPAGMDQAAYEKWAAESMSFLKDNNFNTAIFQIRPTGDALYPSQYAPWSSFVTGKAQGTDPGYDPLKIMIEQAHKRGIELHAWINPYRLTMPSDKVENFSLDNIAALNPGWVVSYGGQHYLNPGLPEVRAHLVSVVSEITDNYDVDAIHIDDYFYPYPVSGSIYNDDEAFAAYGRSFDNKDDWRRDNVTGLVRDLYAAIKSRKSHVQLGISPFGVWRNKASDSTGSDTRAGHECYDSLYADTRLWIREGIIDYIAPQIYWSTAFEAANYKILADWWNEEIAVQAVSKPVNLYVGMANYKVGNNADAQWNNVNEISSQVALNRGAENIQGQMHYSFASIKENSLNHLNILKDTHYAHKALTPAIPSISHQTSLPLTGLTGEKSEFGPKLNITSGDVNTRKFLVYRFEGNAVGDFNAQSLLEILYRQDGTSVYFDGMAEKGKTYCYAVKPVSATGIVNPLYKSVVISY